MRHNLLLLYTQRRYPTYERETICLILHVGSSHEATEWMAAVGAHTISL